MDILQVLTNTALQFVFFGVNLILLPALVIRLTESFANGFNPTLATIRMWIKMPLNLVLTIIVTPIQFIFANLKANINVFKLSFEVGRSAMYDVGTQISLLEELYDEIDVTPPIYNVWRQIGFYIEKILCLCVPSALSVLMVYLLLPETYASVAASIESWTAFQSGTPNLDFFTNMAVTFKNLIWDGFILGALNENILLFILIIVLAVFVFGIVDMNMLYADVFDFSGNVYADEKGNLVDDEGQIIMSRGGQMGKKKRIFFKTWMCLPSLAIALIAFNFIFAAINYQAYTQVASVMSNIGMIVLLVLIVQIIITLIYTCPKLIIKLIKSRV